MAGPGPVARQRTRPHLLGAAITELRSITPPVAPPRAQGTVALTVKVRAKTTALHGLRQSGSLKCLFPRRTGPQMQAVLVNTAGGLTGGDRFALRAELEQDCHLTLTTQAAERAYRARPGETGRIETTLRVQPGAHLNWLPQEMILFDGCALSRSLTIDMAPSASLLMVEPLAFGRLAMGETLTSAAFRDRIEIRRADTPVYLDALHLIGDVQARLDRPGVAGGARAMASVVYIAPDAEARLASLRHMLPDRAGASLLCDDVLVLRLLAPDSYTLRTHLVPILTYLSSDGLPRCWTL